MSRFLRSLRLAALICALPVSSWAAANSQGGSDSALRLMRSSGMYEQLGTLAPAIEQQMEMQAGGIPERVRSQITKAMRESYAASLLRESAHQHLERNLSAVHLDEVEAWLGSRTGRRITELEKQASTPEAVGKIQAFASSLSANPPKPDRLLLIQNLDRLTRSSQSGTEVTVRMAAAVAHGLVAASGQTAAATEIDAAIEAQRPMLAASVQQATLVTFLYTYQSLPESELREYIAFMDSASGRWYSGATVAAMTSAPDQAAARLQKNLASAPASAR